MSPHHPTPPALKTVAPHIQALLDSDLGPDLSRLLCGLRQGHVVGPPEVRGLLDPGALEGALSWSQAAEPAARPGPTFILAGSFVEEEEIRRLYQARGEPTVGLFSSIVPAAAARRAAGTLSTGDVEGPTRREAVERRYALLSTARVGSGYLCGLLKEAGLGLPAEHVRTATLPALQAGMPVERFLDAMEPYAARNGVFGTKLPLGMFAKACGGRADQLMQASEALQRRGYAHFRLTRNPIDCAVSWGLAIATRFWHVGSASAEEARKAQQDAAPDDAGLIAFIYARVAQDVMAERILPAPAATFSYEQLDEDGAEVVRTIASALSRPAAPSAKASQLPVKLSADNPSYLRWRRRACELVQQQQKTALPRAVTYAVELTGLPVRELRRWPEFEANLQALAAAAAQGLAASA